MSHYRLLISSEVLCSRLLLKFFHVSLRVCNDQQDVGEKTGAGRGESLDTEQSVKCSGCASREIIITFSVCGMSQACLDHIGRDWIHV